MKKIVIVGATSGIGLALAGQFIAKGYQVGGCGRNTSALQDIEKEHGSKFKWVELDIRTTETISPALDKLITKMEGMDIFIVSSSIGGSSKELDWEIERDVIQTNVVGYSAALNFAADYFRKKGGGHIAGISSLTKYFGFRNSAYNASKAFEAIYLEGLRLRLEKDNIHITEIVPGFIETPMTSENKKMFWVVPVEKAARQIIRAVGRKRRVVYISKRWRLFALLLPWLPYFLIRKIYRAEQKVLTNAD